ncbi:hypothetical protein YC2023_049941 [Brassica napus]
MVCSSSSLLFVLRLLFVDGLFLRQSLSIDGRSESSIKEGEAEIQRSQEESSLLQ